MLLNDVRMGKFSVSELFCSNADYLSPHNFLFVRSLEACTIPNQVAQIYIYILLSSYATEQNSLSHNLTFLGVLLNTTDELYGHCLGRIGVSIEHDCRSSLVALWESYML